MRPAQPKIPPGPGGDRSAGARAVERGAVIAVIAVTPQMRVLVAIEPTDFRRGIDGLARLVRAELGSDPFSGCVFVFRNRRASAVKILAYDGRGYWLCQKRLSRGRFHCWSGRAP